MDEDGRPAANLEVPPRAIAPRGRRAPLAVLALVLVAITGAVGIAQLAPPPAQPPAAVATPPVPTTLPPSASPSPSASAGLPPVAAFPPRLTPADLAERVDDGPWTGAWCSSTAGSGPRRSRVAATRRCPYPARQAASRS